MTKEALKLALEAVEEAVDCAKNGYISNYLDDWENAITAIKEALAQPEQEPVVLKWQQAPIRTAWGDDMVVASIAIDNDHTLSLYCERDQTPKVDVMFARRTWVSLTDEEIYGIGFDINVGGLQTMKAYKAIEAKLRSKNHD